MHLSPINHEDPGELSWLVNSTIPERSFAALVGSPESGKSFLAVDIACCVNTGRPVLGNPALTVARPGPVIYVAAENRDDIIRRVRTWSDVHGVPVTDELYINTTTPDMNKFGEDMAAEWADINPRLIVIDTWARALPGVNENSAGEVGSVFHYMSMLQDLCDASFLIVHHSGRNDPAPRGTGAFLGALDTLLTAEATDPSKGPAYGATLRLSKQKQQRRGLVELPYEIRSYEGDPSRGYPAMVV